MGGGSDAEVASGLKVEIYGHGMQCGYRDVLDERSMSRIAFTICWAGHRTMRREPAQHGKLLGPRRSADWAWLCVATLMSSCPDCWDAKSGLLGRAQISAHETRRARFTTQILDRGRHSSHGRDRRAADLRPTTICDLVQTALVKLGSPRSASALGVSNFRCNFLECPTLSCGCRV